jgi:sensor domain CHASE-containing protein
MRFVWAGGCLLVIAVFLFWFRWDATSDERMRAKVDQTLSRIEHIQQSNEVTHDIRALDDGALVDELNKRLSGRGNSPR